MSLKRATIDEYLSLDRASDERHEFVAGFISAMTWSTYSHAVVIGNLAGELGSGLRDRPCGVLAANLRIRTVSSVYTFPDVVLVCGKPQFEGDRRDIVTNPSVIVEALSVPLSEIYAKVEFPEDLSPFSGGSPA